MSSINIYGVTPPRMTQEKYEIVAESLGMILQQFKLENEMIGVVNYQATIVRDVIRTYYDVSSIINKSFKDWDKKNDDIDFENLVANFHSDYRVPSDEEFDNPFENSESRFLTHENLQQKKFELSGYN